MQHRTVIFWSHELNILRAHRHAYIFLFDSMYYAKDGGIYILIKVFFAADGWICPTIIRINMHFQGQRYYKVIKFPNGLLLYFGRFLRQNNHLKCRQLRLPNCIIVIVWIIRDWLILCIEILWLLKILEQILPPKYLHL